MESKELAAAIAAGNNELRGLVNAEVSRREGIFGDRVIAALQVGNAIDPSRLKYELAGLLQFCGPIQMVKALAPSLGIVSQGDAEGLVHSAKEALSKFESLIVEAGAKL